MSGAGGSRRGNSKKMSGAGGTSRDNSQKLTAEDYQKIFKGDMLPEGWKKVEYGGKRWPSELPEGWQVFQAGGTMKKKVCFSPEGKLFWSATDAVKSISTHKDDEEDAEEGEDKEHKDDEEAGDYKFDNAHHMFQAFSAARAHSNYLINNCSTQMQALIDDQSTMYAGYSERIAAFNEQIANLSALNIREEEEEEGSA